MIKKYLCVFSILFTCLINLNSCIAALIYAAFKEPSHDLKGTMTTVNTLDGYSYEAILLYYNSSESLKIARNDSSYYVYAYITTEKDLRPGSLFIIVNGERHNICSPIDWYLDKAVYYQDEPYRGNLKEREWSTHKRLSTATVEALLNANIVVFRAINSRYYLGYSEGVDISSILPKVKEFISK